MADSRFLILSCLTLACAHGALERQPLRPDNGPSVQVGTGEALIVFPPDPQTDFPWPAQTLPDRFAGPFWNFVAVRPGRPAVSAAAKLGSLDSLAEPSYASLPAVVSATRLYSCGA